MLRLNKYQKLIAIGMLEVGVHNIDIAEHLGMSHSIIINLAARYRVHGTVDELPSSGRPQITTPVQYRHIQTSHIHIYVIAFYWQCQLPWLLQVVRTTK